jgi:hypothetical protein
MLPLAPWVARVCSELPHDHFVCRRHLYPTVL